jgi:hypothetical protein
MPGKASSAAISKLPERLGKVSPALAFLTLVNCVSLHSGIRVSLALLIIYSICLTLPSDGIKLLFC